MPPFEYAPALADLGRIVSAKCLEYLEWVALGPGQKKVLFLVLGAPGISQAAVSHTLGTHKSVISRAVKALIQARYISRRSAPDGPETRSLYPTRMAVVLKKQISVSTDEVEEQLTVGFLAEELVDFRKYIQRAKHNLSRQPGLSPTPGIPPGSFR